MLLLLLLFLLLSTNLQPLPNANLAIALKVDNYNQIVNGSDERSVLDRSLHQWTTTLTLPSLA